MKDKESIDLDDVAVGLGMNIEIMEGTHALLQDLLEEFTAASFTQNPQQKYYTARLKMSVLLTLMQHGVDGLNESMKEVIQLQKLYREIIKEEDEK